MSIVPTSGVHPLSESTVAQPSTTLLTRSRLQVWGVRSGLSLLDQGLISAASFGVNVVLARWTAPEVYGAFAVAFAAFIFVWGFYNALLLEPLSVLGPSVHAKRLAAYFREQLTIHALMVGGLALLILIPAFVLWLISPQNPLAGAVLGSGLALPFLLLLWLARRMCYVLQRPSMAVAGSAFNLSFVLAGLFLLRHFGRLSPLTAFLLTGAGSLLAACILLARLALASDEISPEDKILWRPVLAENWRYGRWLVGSTVLNSITNQMQTFLVAFFLGLGAAGVLRALQLPMLAMVQALAAIATLVLPSFSYDFGLGRMQQLRYKARLVSLAVGTVGLCFVGVLALFAGRVEHLMFAGKYAAHAWLMPVLALIPTCMGMSMGYAMAMRARQKPRFDLIANAIAAPAAVFSAIALTYWWGLAGAATSMVAGSAVYMICVLKLYSSISHQPEKQPQSVKPETQ